MMMLLHRLGFLCVLFVFSMGNGTELVSTYSKVARWGASANSSSEPRSNGQSLWTHRSNVNIRSGQNLKTIQPVTYYYSMKVPSTKVDEANVETVPSKGEVQERFNPRPYFDFTFDDPPRLNKEANAPRPSNSKPPPVTYGSPFEGISPLSSSKLPTNTYDSPFTSYNPPNIKPDDFKNNVPDSFNYPPNNNQQPQAEYEPSKNNQPISSSYEAATDSSKLPLLYGAPQSGFYNDSSDNNNNNKPTPSRNKNKPSNFHPPLAPPLDQPSDSYFPVTKYKPQLSNANEDQPYSTNYQMPNNNEDNEYDNNNNPVQDKPPEADDSPYFSSAQVNHNHNSMAESDLSPPPPQTYGKFPQYLDHEPNDHDFYHFGHHDIHHEVHHKPSTTTTTTEAPRAGHYSYYYLGRKLWYIPLYFSVYFIVYVTILILKSIARHKIQFSHHFDKGRRSRALEIASVNQTVIDAIENVQKQYM